MGWPNGGAYTLIASIGQGGMGSVWLARRSDGRFERQVAIKFLSIAVGSETGVQRFRREGESSVSSLILTLRN